MSRGDETPATGEPRLAEPAGAPQVTSLSPATANQAAALLCTVSAETMVLGGALTAAGYVRRRWATADAVLRELARDLPEPTLNALLARLDHLGNIAGPAWLAGDGSASRSFQTDLDAVDNAVRPLRALALRQRLTPPEQQAARRLERALADPLVGLHLDALGQALRGLTQLVALSAPAAEDAPSSPGVAAEAHANDAVPPTASARDAVPADSTPAPMTRMVPVLDLCGEGELSAEAPAASAAATGVHEPEPAASATFAELGSAPPQATDSAANADPASDFWGQFASEAVPRAEHQPEAEGGAREPRLAASAPVDILAPWALDTGNAIGAPASLAGVVGAGAASASSAPISLVGAFVAPSAPIANATPLPHVDAERVDATNPGAQGAAPDLSSAPLSALKAPARMETPRVEAVARARPLAPPVPLVNSPTSSGTTGEQRRHTWSPAPPASRTDRSGRWAFSPDLLDAPTLPDPGSAPSPAQPAPPPRGSTRVANVPFDPGSVTYAMPGSARGYMRAPRGAPPPPAPSRATPTWQRVPPSWPLQRPNKNPRRWRGVLLTLGALVMVLCAIVALVAAFNLTLPGGISGTAGTSAAGGVAQHAAPTATHPAPTHAPPTATPKPLPAVLAIAPTSVRVPCPSSGNSASLALRNTGGEPLRWQVSNPPIVLYFSAYNGTISPGASSTLSVHALWGSKASRAVVFTSDGGSVTVNFTIACH